MIPRVGMHQTASTMMGDRIVKCISTLPNVNKGGIHDGRLNRISDTTCQDAPNGICHDGRTE